MKVESFSREKYHLQGLEPDTAYEFQVSCRILPGRGLWSDWSGSQTRTPAAGEEPSRPKPGSGACIPRETPAHEAKLLLGGFVETLDPDPEPRERGFCEKIAF